ncbi:MAG: thioredoxin-dependent thiol peroxidase [bacterium]
MALKISAKSPDFSGKLQDESVISLTDFKGKWLVLYFYPKDNTPGCTVEACDFSDNMERITSTGAVVIGISPDSAKSHTNFIAKHNLEFNLIADTEKTIAIAYDVWGDKTLFGKAYKGIIRTTYIINPDGIIAEVFENVKVHGHVDQVINRLHKLIESYK